MNSYWIDSTKNLTSYPKLDSNLNTDVCIIGGGITGISCAYKLAKQGLNVIVLEKNKIANSTTGNTTAKITSQHGLFYKYLNDSFSRDFAKKYLNANEEAILDIENIINSENIKCDFSKQDSYVYTTNTTELEKIKNEVNIVKSLGFNCSFEEKIPLPINILGAIKFPNQAQFNPLKYVNHLCASITTNAGKIFENTTVLDIKHEDNSYLTLTDNHYIKSKYVIIASHYPIINTPGFYFLKMYQETSYVIAVSSNNEFPSGMYINSEKPTYSFRTAIDNTKKLLIIGGLSHKTGQAKDLSQNYKILENKAKELYPDCKVEYKWQTEDTISLDKIPYIGEFSKMMPNVFLATGFKKWGMTTSNLASNIITDKILGIDNNFQDIFLSTRFHPVKNHTEFTNMIKETTNSLITEKLKLSETDVNKIKKGEGKIIEVSGKKVGVFKDFNGNIFSVNPTCSHLGCLLNWNNLELTWDCPCHGSRFDYTGKSLYSPSIRDLERY